MYLSRQLVHRLLTLFTMALREHSYDLTNSYTFILLYGALGYNRNRKGVRLVYQCWHDYNDGT
jgi:hypothetical protein